MSGDGASIILGGLLAFAEAILGVGVILPGEVMVTGIATSVDADTRSLLWLAVILGATAGDHLNYWLGRTFGPRLARSRLVARIGVRHWDRAVTMVRRHGAWAIVLSRLLPVVRTIMAAVAGVSAMPYRRFTAASLAGSVLWATIWVGAGDVLRAALERPLWGLPVLAAGAFIIVVWRARSSGQATEG